MAAGALLLPVEAAGIEPGEFLNIFDTFGITAVSTARGIPLSYPHGPALESETMIRPTLMPVLLAFVLASFAGCSEPRPRAELSGEPIQTAALSCPPVPACPAVPECPAPEPAPECPPPPVCPPPPEPPAPVELSFSAAVVGPLRAEVAIQWDVRGCSPSGVELLGEAGQVVIVRRDDVVPVVNLTRPGVPLIERFSVWARATCDDGRSQVAGPFILTGAVRATGIRSLVMRYFPSAVATNLRHTVEGGFLLWADDQAVTDPTVTHERLSVYDASGQELHHHQIGSHTTGQGEAPTRPFWFEGTRLVGQVYDSRGNRLPVRSFWDYMTQIGGTYNTAEPPPPAFTFPANPDALRSWGGLWAPHANDSSRAWVLRGGKVGLVNLSE
jgi:hypothetical protein